MVILSIENILLPSRLVFVSILQNQDSLWRRKLFLWLNLDLGSAVDELSLNDLYSTEGGKSRKSSGFSETEKSRNCSGIDGGDKSRNCSGNSISQVNSFQNQLIEFTTQYSLTTTKSWKKEKIFIALKSFPSTSTLKFLRHINTRKRWIRSNKINIIHFNWIFTLDNNQTQWKKSWIILINATLFILRAFHKKVFFLLLVEYIEA